ncbi:MAG TPA: thioredoxin domain-containing protein [Prolixibacteraceae bacterium]|nr:thioredoxin domain-containing protein [Prolixibacteraceae bacterium]
MIKRNIAFTLLLALFSVFMVENTSANTGKAPENEKTGEVIKITRADFISKVMDYEKNQTEWIYKGDKPCLIDFYADWCGPCRITSPILDELATEYASKIIIYKVNVDIEKELSQVFGVKGIPAFLYCPMEGKPSMTSGIGRDKDQTKEMFKSYIETILLKTEK